MKLIAMGNKIAAGKVCTRKGFSLLELEHNRFSAGFLEKNYRRELCCTPQRNACSNRSHSIGTKLDTDGKARSTLLPRLYRFLPETCRGIPTRQSGPSSLLPPGRSHRRLSDLHRWGYRAGRRVRPSHQHFGRHASTTRLGIGVQRERPGGRVISFGHAGFRSPDIRPTCNSILARAPSGRSWLTAMGGTGEIFMPVLKALQPIVETLGSAFREVCTVSIAMARSSD